jgi:phosphoserine phosphatase
VAVFDWDNTMMRGDMGDTLMSWLLRNERILQPRDRDWALTNRHLTDDALTTLHAACDRLAAPGQSLATASAAGRTCGAEILAIYARGHTVVGRAAWRDEVTPTMNRPFAWLTQLLAGHLPNEVHGFALAAYHDAAAMPATRDVPEDRFVRIHAPMRDLVGALAADGFDVWVVSASPQLAIEAIAPLAGVAADHVVGIRTLVDPESGRLTARVVGCGPFVDGEDQIIPFDTGKRCWINKAIFGRPPTAQLVPATSAEQRPTLVGGDSDGDIAMLKDASELKLVIDRGRMQVMCNALANRGGRWLVQPMFVLPDPPHTAPYPCSHALDAAGAFIVDEEGRPIPDQRPR